MDYLVMPKSKIHGEGSDGYPSPVGMTGDALNMALGTSGGADSVTPLGSFLVAGGASQAGAAINFPSGRSTFQAVANGSSGSFTATVNIMVSLDNTNWETLGTITLSGTATTADSDGFAVDAPWAYVRADVAAFTGTGATCAVSMGV